MSFIDNINSATSTVKNAYSKIAQKKGVAISDSSKNTSFLASTIQTIPEVMTGNSINATQSIDKTESTYAKSTEGNNYFNYVKVQYNVDTIDEVSANLDSANNIEYTISLTDSTKYLADDVNVKFKTKYYKQLEFLNSSISCPFPRVNAFAVVSGFKCKLNDNVNYIILDNDSSFMKAYGIACLLSNANNDISINIDKCFISYNYVDYTIVGNKFSNPTYGHEYNCDYITLFSNINYPVASKADIISNIGNCLNDCSIKQLNDESYEDAGTMHTYIVDKNYVIIDYYQLRIYYNVNVISTQISYADNAFIPLAYNSDATNLVKSRQLSITNKLGNNANAIKDPIDETAIRLNYDFTCISNS